MKTDDDERKQEQNDEERVRQGTAEHSDEEWKVGSEKQARIHTVNNMSEKNPDGKHAIFKRKLTV